MDRLRGIEVFVRVVEDGSVTAAAASLQTAKSSVSDAVRALEERLGVRLLERTTRHIRPTGAGRLFYARARRVLDEAQAARDEVRLFQSAPSGRLRAAVPEAFGERFILPGLPSFLAAFPAVTVELLAAARHVRLVEEEFDVAIRMVAAPAPTLVARRIGAQRIILVASPSYLSQYGMPEQPSDLLRHHCVGTAPPLPWHDGWRIGEETTVVTPRVVVNTGEALRAAAITGMGIAPSPEWIVGDALAAGLLTRVLADFATAVSGIYAVYPTNRLLTPVVRAFVDHLVRDLRARGVTA
ncbi:MAG: LysR family transcriptional regulator [Acetobacteraceae bacterium]|nr:LysR family transcriptional regulator [Pseudomonadota bacterium]